MMPTPPRLLIVSASHQELQNRICTIVNCDPIAVPDASSAVISLRLLGHSVTAALFDLSTVQEDLDELTVYFRSVFPEVTLTLLGTLPPKEQKRLKCLGISHFFTSTSFASDMVKSLLKRSSKTNRKMQNPDDWTIVVDRNEWVEISVPSRKEYVARIQELLDLLGRSQIDQDTRDEMMLAIDELVTNAMEWGNRYDASRRVRVSYYYTQDRIVFKIEDEGEGFHTGDLIDPSEDLDAHLKKRKTDGKRPGGFGVHMIRNLMDEFLYNEQGNVVLFTKFLNQKT